jgi:hypothetical protein
MNVIFREGRIQNILIELCRRGMIIMQKKWPEHGHREW